MSNSLHLSWHAVYVKDRYEKKVADVLNKKDIETYCPHNNKQKSDRKKSVSDLLFGSLLFVKIDAGQAPAIRNISGVINFAYWLGSPVEIKEEEISAIKTMVATKEPLKIEKTKVDFSGQVALTHKRLVEREGKLVQILHVPYSANIPSLGYCIVTEDAGKQVIEIESSEAAAPSNQGRQIFLEQLSKEVG